MIPFCSWLCACLSTLVCSAWVNVSASIWFAVDCVFLMTFVPSFVLSVGFFLTNSDNILQLDVSAFRCTSDNIVSVDVPASDCLTVDWVLRCDFWFQFRDVYRNLLTSNDNVLADFAWFWFQFLCNYVFQCACMKLIFCGSSIWWFLFPVLWCP